MRCVLPTMRSMRIKFFTATVIVLAVYLFLFYLVIEVFFISKHSPTAVTSVVLPYVVVHIDLKGAPPKLKYLETLLPMLKEHGVNALLMEYEDMFPYDGKLANLSSKNCYDKVELTKFLKKAVESDFEIIPLIQTFGHLEHALKLEEFRSLREVQMYPDSLCPSQYESRALVKHMLEQVIHFHNLITPLKYIHVGCDEVFQINKCELCKAKDLSNTEIFIDYLIFLSEHVRELAPTTTMLIWDDMMRSFKPIEWTTIFFINNIEPVYWDYEPNLRVSHLNLLNYHKKFQSIWIASAFKGADGRLSTTPDIKKRFLNHFNWLKLILNYKFGGETRRYSFKGIILTGWSRYTHMDPICELLPVAIPSLILNLLLVKKFKTGIVANDETSIDIDEFYARYINDDCNKSLKCKKNIVDFETVDCDFESYQLYNVLKQYEVLKTNVASEFNNDISALPSIEYYDTKKFINMNNIMPHINWVNNTLNELLNIEVMMNHFMTRYYEKDVIDEYVNSKTYSAKKKLRETLKILNEYIRTRTWDRKPFGNASEHWFRRISKRLSMFLFK